MSRTYHHGDKAKKRLFGFRHYYFDYRFEVGAEAPRKRKRRENDWNWMSTPSWWIHDMMQVPQRARVRFLMSLVWKGNLEQTWPLAKKPHKYYW